MGDGGRREPSPERMHLSSRELLVSLMLLGIGLFSAITATITSYFISQETPAAEPADRLVQRLQRLSELRREGSLRTTLAGRLPPRMIGSDR